MERPSSFCPLIACRNGTCNRIARPTKYSERDIWRIGRACGGAVYARDVEGMTIARRHRGQPPLERGATAYSAARTTARHVAVVDRAGHLLVAIATMSATLTVKVLRGEGLRAADSNGSSDPYAILHVGDAKPWRSQTRHRDLNPVWNGSAIFERVPLQRTPYATVEVWDADLATADDPLGKAMLPIAQLLLACADGLECEVPLGRRAAKQQACGSLWVHLSAVPDLSIRISPYASPPAPLTEYLPAAAQEYGKFCARADARPTGLGSPSAAELLEARIDGVFLEFFNAVSAEGSLYVSNARLVFVPLSAEAAKKATAVAVEAAPAPVQLLLDAWCGGAAAATEPAADHPKGEAEEEAGDADADDADANDCGGGCGLLGSSGSLFVPLHAILRVEQQGGETHDRGAAYYFLPSSYRGGNSKEPTDVGSGGSLTLSLLPSLEFSLHFTANAHGSGRRLPAPAPAPRVCSQQSRARVQPCSPTRPHCLYRLYARPRRRSHRRPHRHQPRSSYSRYGPLFRMRWRRLSSRRRHRPQSSRLT